MNGVNLIPEHRRIARNRHVRIRRWMMGCAAYAIAAIAVCSTARAIYEPDSRNLNASRVAAVKLVTDLGEAVNATRLQLSAVNSNLQTIRTVTGQPDWSILLTALANAVEKETVLGSATLQPQQEASSLPAKPADATAAPQYNRWQLDLQGHGLTQSAVSHFVTRLQQTGLFSEIKLLRTSREPYLRGHAIAFQLQCILTDQRSIR